MLMELSVMYELTKARITPQLSAWPGTKCPHPPKLTIRRSFLRLMF